MKDSIEYQIFVGCTDSHLKDEIVNVQELREMVSLFFQRRQIDFSMLIAKGGYLYENGWFMTENTLCINIIGDSALDIVRLAKTLSMYMNQEHVLIVRNALKTRFH